MARRHKHTSFLIQVQRDMARASAQAQRAQAAAVREQVRAQRQADQARRAAQVAFARDEREAKAAYHEARAEEVEADNAVLAARVEAIQSLLADTLDVDDYVDLHTLRRRAEHPPFDAQVVGPAPKQPVWGTYAPVEPTGMSKAFGGKKKHAAATADARARFEVDAAAACAQLVSWQRHLAQAQRRYQRECAEREEQAAQHNASIDAFAEALASGEPGAVVDYVDLILARSSYPEDFPHRYKVGYVPESKQLVVEAELPSVEVLPAVRTYRYVKSRDEVTSSARPAADVKALYASLVVQVTLRTLNEVFDADRAGHIQVVVFNGVVATTDRATGKPVRPCLVTVRTTREVFTELDLAKVDPLACLAHLNASVSKRPDELVPVRPVLEFDMVDKRFVEETDVLSGLDERPNLLDLTPTEFESLIQNLFAKMGLETRQTRASRDGGVDCVAFDPRPIFGGKVVIQAKRYKNTVDVSAVRDLYGSMQNEGASKGILVATSGYGLTSYEFASGKPLELIDGSNLLYLLKEHANLEARIAAP